MNVVLSRQWSLGAIVTPADALSSGRILLQIKNELEPEANQVLTGKLEFGSGTSSASHHQVNLRYWKSCGYGPHYSYATGFTGLDVNGSPAQEGPEHAYFRELWFKAPDVPEFSYYKNELGIAYNPMLVYVQAFATDFSHPVPVYPGTFFSFGGLTESERGEAFGVPEYLYVTSLHGGAVHNDYPPSLEVMQLRTLR